MRRAALGTALALGATFFPPSAEPEERKNIVFILLDDAHRDLFAYMPNVQHHLVEGGMTFKNYYYNQSLCCPSRATMLRGQYNHNTHVMSNSNLDGGYGQFVEAGNEQSTVGTWLDDAGYQTGYFGKYLNGYPEDGGMPDTHVPPGWDDWFGGVEHVYRGYDYVANDNGEVVSYGFAEEDYLTDVIAAKAIDFIAEADGPFMLWATPTAPHVPSKPAVRHQGMFDDVPLPRAASFNEADVSDKPADIRRLPPMSEEKIASLTRNWQKRLASVQAVDEMLAGITQALSAKGALDSTYIVFASDNGYLMGQHRYDGKNTPYKGDVSSEMYVTGPGIVAGSVNRDMVANVDLAQTFADMAHAPVPDFVDGRSLLPLLTGASPEWRRTFLLARGGKSVEQYVGLLTANYTYVEYANGEGEFYDRRVDPAQLTNAYDSMDLELRASLSARIDALENCSGDTCRAVEQRRL